MRKFSIIAVVGVFCMLLAVPALAEEAKKEEAKKPEMPAGQKVFVDAKCNMCHTVYSAGIGEPPAEEEKEGEEKTGPPDLSMTGKGRTAEWMTGFLKKEVALNDKKHMKAFKGEDKDLKALVTWLLTLKPAEEEKPKAETTEAAAPKAAEKAESGEKADAGDKADAGEKHEGSEHEDHGGDSGEKQEDEKGK